MKAIILIPCIIFLPFSCKEREDKKETIFPKGNKAPATNFTGTVWLHPVVAKDSIFDLVIGSATFEPGARSN